MAKPIEPAGQGDFAFEGDCLDRIASDPRPAARHASPVDAQGLRGRACPYVEAGGPEKDEPEWKPGEEEKWRAYLREQEERRRLLRLKEEYANPWRVPKL